MESIMDLYDYEKLLEKAYKKIPENVKKSSRFEIPKVVLRIESKNTFIVNFAKIKELGAMGGAGFIATIIFKKYL